jgi:peptidoglycan-N-acetylglucosamine deacetylase
MQGCSLNYKPSHFIQASLWLHGAALIAALLQGALPYALGLLMINHLTLIGLGLWPKSEALGSNWVRLPVMPGNRCVALTLDDGPDPKITPKVLEILKTFDIKATFFCIGKQLERYPDLAREITKQGHAIENHSYSHGHTFSFWGVRRLNADIARAQSLIQDLTGRKPQFFRAPAGLRNPLLDLVLQRQGLQLCSWTRRGYDTQNSDSKVVLNRLLKGLSEGDIVLAHDGNSARDINGSAVILTVLPALLIEIQSRKLHCVRLDQVAR